MKSFYLLCDWKKKGRTHGFRFVLAAIFATLLAATLSSAKGSTNQMPALQLIPSPQSVERSEGTFTIGEKTRVFLPRDTARPELLAAQRLLDAIEASAGFRPAFDRPGLRPVEKAGSIHLAVKDPPETDPLKAEGYTLEISGDAVVVTGNSARGLFYGIQTLKQLVDQFGAKLPALKIEDAPDFEHRGFYFDISRGKVPTLETYKWLADYLAERKVNMLQLYVEHPFEFNFDPSIKQTPDALTAEEVLEMVAYCKDRHIDFVPSLASFGHMGGVLSLPQYKHLADVEMENEWADMTWRQRMVGATINMNDPEALELLEKMHDEFLPLFDSDFVNMCADETYDLGEGKNKELAEKEGKHTLYLRHINWLNDLSKKYGKRMMFWGDIIVQAPERIADVPKDSIALNWAYWRSSNYDSSKHFADAGVDFFVVPGVSGWNRISNGIVNADINIRKQAEAGKKYGAIGLLNTDWGDYGNYNMLSGSLHGIALGAAMAWNPDEPGVEEFDAVWNAQTFGVDDGRGAATMREQSDDGADYLVTWPLFYRPLDDQEVLKKVSKEQAEKFVRDGQEGHRVFSDYLSQMKENRWIAEEWSHMSRMNALLGEKVQIMREIEEGGGSKELAMRLDAFADKTDRMFAEYAEFWLARNKRTDLALIEEKFNELSAQARTMAREMQAGAGK